MAEYIPFEIQEDIIKSLPVKSLIKFISVSKQWKSFITSSQFIADYHMDQQHLLVSYVDPEDYEEKYVSIVDDYTFPQNKLSLFVPTSIQQFNRSVQKNERTTIVGISHGLFCFYNFFGCPNISGKNMAAIWNPAIRKSVAFNVPNVSGFPYQTLVGFGVCPNTSDVKIVKIKFVDNPTITSIPNQVEVLTLSSGAWRSPSTNLPRKSITIDLDQVDIDGFFYWLALDGEPMEAQSDDLILSFDITGEEFKHIYLPARESLAVLVHNLEAKTQVYDVWIMEHGVPNSFKKLFTINTPYASIDGVHGFRKNGEAIIETANESEEEDALFVLEPFSKQIKYIGVTGKRYSCFASFYVETLLLLDR